MIRDVLNFNLQRMAEKAINGNTHNRILITFTHRGHTTPHSFAAALTQL